MRNFGPATAFPGGVTLTATWNPTLAELVGAELGRDARAKGVHFLLAPGVNINRAPMNGRNFEYFGEDPFLASRIAVGYIKGVQSQGVSATVKHFLGNNSEFDRHNTDSIIDERTLREIYLPVFEAAVKEAHVGAIMDSYNLTNGLHMSQNKYLLTDVVKKEWGFDGLIMSDWSGTYDGIEAANAGQDLEMPSGLHMNEQTLKPAIEQGKVSLAIVDDKVRRILRTAARFGWLDRDQTDLDIPRYNPQGRQVALNAAREGITLLKNEGGLLPLDKSKIKSILIVGPDAFPAVPVGGGSAEVQPFAAVSFLEGLTNYAGTHPDNPLQVFYDRGLLSYSDLANATNFTTSQIDGKPGMKAEYFDNLELKGTPVITRTEEHLDVGQVITPRKISGPTMSSCKRREKSAALIVFTLMTNSCWTIGPHLQRSSTIVRFGSTAEPTRLSWSNTDAPIEKRCVSGWGLSALDNLLAITSRNLPLAPTWWWWPQVSMPSLKRKAPTGLFDCRWGRTS